MDSTEATSATFDASSSGSRSIGISSAMCASRVSSVATRVVASGTLRSNRLRTRGAPRQCLSNAVSSYSSPGTQRAKRNGPVPMGRASIPARPTRCT